VNYNLRIKKTANRLKEVKMTAKLMLESNQMRRAKTADRLILLKDQAAFQKVRFQMRRYVNT
jgi:hypothetical protein